MRSARELIHLSQGNRTGVNKCPGFTVLLHHKQDACRFSVGGTSLNASLSLGLCKYPCERFSFLVCHSYTAILSHTHPFSSHPLATQLTRHLCRVLLGSRAFVLSGAVVQNFSYAAGTFFVGGGTTRTATGRRTFAVARQACDARAPFAAAATSKK